MSRKLSMSSHALAAKPLVALLLSFSFAGLHAQQPTPPRVELFGGYSAFYPHATASGLLPLGITPVASCLCWNPRGAGASLTYDFNRWAGFTVDMSGHWGNGAATLPGRLGEFSAYNVAAGPKFTFRRHNFAPFAEVLFGGDRLAPELFQRDDRFGLLAGGGIDVRVGSHFAIRPVQADFVYANHQFGPAPLVPATDVRGLRLQAGVVFLFGGHAAAMPVLTPKPIAAPVAAAPAPAPLDQVTLSLVASPASVMAGESSTIQAAGVSSLNRPLTYSFQASSGVISGTGSTALLNTVGLAAGTIVIHGNVVDDQGVSAAATTSVQVMPAAVVAAAVTRSLGTIGFNRDMRRPARVDNEAKAILDDAALTLLRDASAMLAVVGSAAPGEPHGTTVAAERAVNTKAYLVGEKGIDASRISVFTGPENQKQVEIILIPTGASLDRTGLTAVDETTVHPQPRQSHARPR